MSLSNRPRLEDLDYDSLVQEINDLGFILRDPRLTLDEWIDLWERAVTATRMAKAQLKQTYVKLNEIKERHQIKE